MSTSSVMSLRSTTARLPAGCRPLFCASAESSLLLRHLHDIPQHVTQEVFPWERWVLVEAQVRRHGTDDVEYAGVILCPNQDEPHALHSESY